MLFMVICIRINLDEIKIPILHIYVTIGYLSTKPLYYFSSLTKYVKDLIKVKISF